MESSQLEILLFTNTRFALRQFSEQCDIERWFDDLETGNLEQACWYGLLWESLPELFFYAGGRKELVLWKIIQADHFLELEYGQILQRRQFCLSINPYLFLNPQLLS